jgi:cytochrome oxidase assembly protein ShyY1
MVIAHVAGVPVEELLPTAAGAGSMVLLARGWVALRLRRHRSTPQRSGRTTAPSSVSPKPGLCATSHAWPSGSRNAPA